MRSAVVVIAAAAAAAALGILAPTAAADQPVTTVTQIDRTRTIPASPETCPFPLIAHTEGVYRETVFSSGKDVAHTVDFHITYTNPANGKSVTTVLGGPFIVFPNGDGTVTATINGNDGHLTVPGEGTVFADVGKLVYIADASDVLTPLTILKSTGRQDPNQFPATCDAIA